MWKKKAASRLVEQDDETIASLHKWDTQPLPFVEITAFVIGLNTPTARQHYDVTEIPYEWIMDTTYIFRSEIGHAGNSLDVVPVYHSHFSFSFLFSFLFSQRFAPLSSSVSLRRWIGAGEPRELLGF